MSTVAKRSNILGINAAVRLFNANLDNNSIKYPVKNLNMYLINLKSFSVYRLSVNLNYKPCSSPANLKKILYSVKKKIIMYFKFLKIKPFSVDCLSVTLNDKRCSSYTNLKRICILSNN